MIHVPLRPLLEENRVNGAADEQRWIVFVVEKPEYLYSLSSRNIPAYIECAAVSWLGNHKENL